MAVFRTAERCYACGEPYMAIHLDQSHLPINQQLIGDTFVRWDVENHTCNKKSKRYKEYLKECKKLQKAWKESGHLEGLKLRLDKQKL